MGTATPQPVGPADREEHSGRLLGGRYRLVAPLGTGGSADVHLAHDELLGRRVGVKVLRATVAGDPDARDRFIREARAAAAVGHPHVVSVFDAGVAADGSPFIVMELVEGMSLEDRLRHDGRLDAPSALTIARQVVEALGAVHRAGLVHRDVKPANILVDRRGVVRLADFGIAKGVLPDSAVVAGRTVGTAAYLAPEQARGAEVSPAADLYALGVVVYRMLSGHLPFEGEDAATLLYQHVYESPATLGLPQTTFNRALTAVVMRLLAKDPADRFSSADELFRVLAALPVPADGAYGSPVPRTIVPGAATQVSDGPTVAVRVEPLRDPRRSPRVLAAVVLAGAVGLPVVAVLATQPFGGPAGRPEPSSVAAPTGQPANPDAGTGAPRSETDPPLRVVDAIAEPRAAAQNPQPGAAVPGRGESDREAARGADQRTDANDGEGRGDRDDEERDDEDPEGGGTGRGKGNEPGAPGNRNRDGNGRGNGDG